MTLTTEQTKKLLAQYANVEESEASAFVDAFVCVIAERLKQGEEVTVNGLGTFGFVDSQQGRRISFLAEEKMKNAVNAPFSVFEPFVIEEGTASKTSEVEDSVEDVSKEENIEIETAIAEETSVEETPVEETPSDTMSDAEEPVAEEPIAETPTTEEEKPKKEAKPLRKESTHRDIPYTTWAMSLLGVAAVLLIGFAALRLSSDEPSDSTKKVKTSQVKTAQVEDSKPVEEIKVEEVTPAVEEKKAEEPQVAEKNVAEKKAEKKAVEKKEEAKKPSSQPKTEPAVAATRPADNQVMHNADGTPVKVKLAEGDRLTLLSLRTYGDKCFWVYIYQVNAFQIPNPDVVQCHLDLYLPDPSYYRIDASDERSVRRAKQLQYEISKRNTSL